MEIHRLKKGEKPVWKGPYYFEVDEDSFINKKIIDFEVTQNDSGNHGLVVIDATHTIVDRNGKLVWYLSKVNWFYKLKTRTETIDGAITSHKDMDVSPVISDLRITPYGTVTYLTNAFALECGLNGERLWQGPNDAQVAEQGGEGYNHDFKRLPNGHYMVLGNMIWRKLPAYSDTLLLKKKYPTRKTFIGKEYAGVEYGTIIEYNKEGKAVWSWNSGSYLDADVLIPIPSSPLSEYMIKPHINAFSTDAKNEFVYAGLRDLNRIVKIDKSSGKVVDSWGQHLPSGEAAHPVALHLQHDANLLKDGTLAVFNSNDYPGIDSFPSVIILSPDTKKSEPEVWRFDCNFDSVDRHKTRNGGNVDLLDNGNYLVCAGNMERIFEVTKDKKIVWQGRLKVREPDGIKYLHRLYRAHYISSLYPCWFTFETDRDTVTQNAARFNIHLFNKGSEEDAYDVSIAAKSGSAIKQFNTNILPAGGSAVFNIDAASYLNNGDKIEITIRSKTNADLEKKRWITVN